MHTDELSAVVDGHDIIVDVTPLHGVEHTAWLVPVVVVAALAAVVVVRGVRVDQRPFLLSAIATGTVGGVVALLSSPVVVGRIASWVPGLKERILEGTTLVGLAGFAIGVLVVLVPLAWILMADRRLAGAVVLAGVAAGVIGGVGVTRAQEQRRTFVRALQRAFPVPRLVFPGQGEGDPLPEVQLGRTRLLAPTTTWQLGLSDGVLFGALGPPAAFPAPDVVSWGLTDTRAVLTGTTLGPQTTRAEARNGPVRVRAPVAFRVVEDKSPAAFPLVVGHRFAFTRIVGPFGATERALKATTARKAPSEDVVVTVLDEDVVDGFRVARVHLLDAGVPRTHEVVAKDGALYRRDGTLFVGPIEGGRCDVPFLDQRQCVCSEKGIERCVRREHDAVGAFVRVGLVIATLGLSEVLNACAGCGDGREVGLILVSRR